MSMTIQEALDEIRSSEKWYFVADGPDSTVPPPTIFSTAQRIEDGRAKPETIKKFFALFGYSVESEYKIVKI